MLYDAYEMQRSMLAGASTLANIGAEWLNNPANPFAYSRWGRSSPRRSTCSPMRRRRAASPNSASTEHDRRRARRSPSTRRSCCASRSASSSTSRARASSGGPKLLIVAPMSGHYATLLRGTVERMLPGHDVYITDWRDAKLVPLDDGRFDLDDYIDYLIEFLEHIGPGAHMLAVCQPSVPGLCRRRADERRQESLPAEDADHDGRADRHPRGADRGQHGGDRAAASPGSRATSSPPCRYLYPGAGRQVYPGFLQLAGFMAMNLGNHLISHWEMFKHLVAGRRRQRRRDQGILRRISLGLRHDRRILPADDRRRVPAPSAAQGRDDASRPPVDPGGDHATSRCSRSRASATISPASARPRPR